MPDTYVPVLYIARCKRASMYKYHVEISTKSSILVVCVRAHPLLLGETRFENQIRPTGGSWYTRYLFTWYIIPGNIIGLHTVYQVYEHAYSSARYQRDSRYEYRAIVTCCSSICSPCMYLYNRSWLCGIQSVKIVQQLNVLIHTTVYHNA